MKHEVNFLAYTARSTRLSACCAVSVRVFGNRVLSFNLLTQLLAALAGGRRALQETESVFSDMTQLESLYVFLWSTLVCGALGHRA